MACKRVRPGGHFTFVRDAPIVLPDELPPAALQRPGRRPGACSIPISARVLLATAGIAIALVSCGRAPDHSSVIGAAKTTSAATLGPKVIADGDEVTGWGLVEATQGSAKFCMPEASEDLSGRLPPCHFGLPVQGVDLSALRERSVIAGTTSGFARLTGIYRTGGLSVISQSTGPPPATYPERNLSSVPCPPPRGGWPRGPAEQNIDLTAADAYKAAHPEVVMVAELRPSSTQVVAYVLTSGDVPATATALRGAFGARLCVAKSKYANAAITSAQRDFMPTVRAGVGGGIASESTYLGPDSQIFVWVDCMFVTADLKDRTAHAPVGLVQLHPWLTPKN